MQDTLARKHLCQIHAGAVLGAVSCQIVASSGAPAPEWVQMFPAPDAKTKKIAARDGRVFKLSDPSAFVASFNAQKHDVPFDLEHASEIKAPNGDPAPASGWITELQERGGEVWARVEWTSDGAEAVQSRKYRYASPAFNTDRKSGEITTLVSAGLTNRPALNMPALASIQGADIMHPEVLKKLGLPETCSVDDVIAEINKLKQGGNGLSTATPMLNQGGNGLSTAQAEHAAEMASLKAQHATELAAAKKTPAMTEFIPRADYDLVVGRVAAMEQTRANEKAAQHKEAVELALTGALSTGKISPATKEFYASTCSSPEGLAAFCSFVKSAPVIAPANIVTGQVVVADGVTMLSAEQLASAKKAGVSKATIEAGLKYLAETADA